MIKVYMKQAWELLKQNKLFSALYIIGTGLSIAMTMVIAIVCYVRLAPVYPENNRTRTLVVKSAQMTKADGNSSSSISYQLLNDWLYPLEDAEAVTGIWDPFSANSSYGQIYLPYTCVDGYDKSWNQWGLGSFNAYILIKSREDLSFSLSI